jgi:hypothetical protein
MNLNLFHEALLNAGNRCADRRFPRSRSTVGVEVKCSNRVQLKSLVE